MLTATYESKEYILLINDHYRADEYHKNNNKIILYIYHSKVVLLFWIPNESYSSLAYINYYAVTSFLMEKLCTVR